MTYELTRGYQADQPTNTHSTVNPKRAQINSRSKERGLLQWLVSLSILPEDEARACFPALSARLTDGSLLCKLAAHLSGCCGSSGGDGELRRRLGVMMGGGGEGRLRRGLEVLRVLPGFKSK
jgi:hypothetical protein